MTRTTGKTWAQIAALPDGSVYVVEDQRERRHVMQLLLAQGRARNALFILLVTDRRDDLGRVHGLPRATLYDVDHDATLIRDNSDLAFLLSRITRRQAAKK